MKPEILTQPNIPKPLHGLSPRTIMGQEWWDTKRQEVYKSTNYHCSACGVEKVKAKKHRWLEAHEYYKFDYKSGTAEIISIEPLCHYCHNFIHSGRLVMILGKEKTVEEVIEILEHGFKILSDNKLKCFPFTLDLARSLGVNTYGVKPYKLSDSEIEWNDWRLIFNGKEHKSKFDSYEDWETNYN